MFQEAKSIIVLARRLDAPDMLQFVMRYAERIHPSYFLDGQFHLVASA